MPDDRMLHRCQGHSAKLAQCDHLTYRVWTQYLLSADDYGVMPDSAALIRGDNFALEQEPEASVVAALEQIRQLGLVESFAHQGRKYLCSLTWQDYQHVRFPRVSHYPVPPAEVLQKCSGETSELFKRHSERKGLDGASQPLANANGKRLEANGKRQTATIVTGPHPSHAFCSIACVPSFLHQEFRSGLNRDNQDEADDELCAGYRAHIAAWPKGKAAGDAIKFWRAWYQAQYPAPSARDTKQAAEKRRQDEFFARQK